MDWAYCPKYYFLKRTQGWQEREQRASMVFGSCVEAAITARCLGVADPLAAFDKEWEKSNPEIAAPEGASEQQKVQIEKQCAKNAAMVYSQVEKDWARMSAMGHDMLRLFEAMLPTLPIVRPKFQVELNPQLFPNTKLAGINFVAYLDVISSPPVDHPALVKIEAMPEQKFRPLIIDIKVKG
ncbi:MAG: hypothetical protein KGI03_04895, partial [Patescibacteria group bacterium]|nr:hypothetical protein [Patescibacteria group bacterium]